LKIFSIFFCFPFSLTYIYVLVLKFMFGWGVNGLKIDDREIRCVHVFSRVLSHVVLAGEKLYVVPAQVRARL
jgi:hypothetical protein